MGGARARDAKSLAHATVDDADGLGEGQWRTGLGCARHRAYAQLDAGIAAGAGAARSIGAAD